MLHTIMAPRRRRDGEFGDGGVFSDLAKSLYIAQEKAIIKDMILSNKKKKELELPEKIEAEHLREREKIRGERSRKRQEKISEERSRKEAKDAALKSESTQRDSTPKAKL